MPGLLGHDKSLPRRKLHGAVLEIDEKPSFDDVEKFVFCFVEVPVIFALDHADPHDRIVHRA